MTKILMLYNSNADIPNLDGEFPLHLAAKNFSSINTLRAVYKCSDINNRELWIPILVNPSDPKFSSWLRNSKVSLQDILPEYWLMHPTLLHDDLEGNNLTHLLAAEGSQKALIALGKLLNENVSFSSSLCNTPNKAGYTPLDLASGLPESDQAAKTIKQQIIDLLARDTSEENQRKARRYLPQSGDTTSSQIGPAAPKP
jgi:hypothetical protein